MKKVPNPQATEVAMEAATRWAHSAEEHMLQMPAGIDRAHACAAISTAWSNVAIAINTSKPWDEQHES